MGARVYIPVLGRFLQVDPIEGGTDNNYVYANDPVNQFDLDGKAKKKRGVKPNAFSGYAHYLFGGGKTVNMEANSVTWSISQKSLKRLGTGKMKERPVSAVANGFHGGYTIGDVSGTFTGTIRKSGNKYVATGSFTPIRDKYNFDIDPRRDLSRNVKNAIGWSVGAYISHRSLGVVRPQNYYIQFNGSGRVR